MPPIGQIHIDNALTNLSIMYKNSMYMADSVMPIIPVAKRSDKYFVYKREDFLSASSTDTQGKPTSLRRPGTEAAEIDYTQTTGQYYAEEYALRAVVTDAEYSIADSPLQPDIDQTLQLTERLMIDNEVSVFAYAMNRSNFATANKVALTTSTTSWAAYASTASQPFADIKNGKLAVIKGIAMDANMIAFSIGTAKTLADHPLVNDLVKYVHEDALTNEGLPKVIRGLQVQECKAIKNTASEGAAYSGNYIAIADDGTDAALIYYSNPSPTLRTVSFGYTFEAPDDTTGVRGISTRKWREEKRKGSMIECAFLRDWKPIGVDSAGKSVAGYLITSCTA